MALLSAKSPNFATFWNCGFDRLDLEGDMGNNFISGLFCAQVRKTRRLTGLQIRTASRPQCYLGGFSIESIL
jgi:hypothetical protein